MQTEKGSEKFLKIKKMTNQKYSKSELSLQEEKLQEWNARLVYAWILEVTIESLCFVNAANL